MQKCDAFVIHCDTSSGQVIIPRLYLRQNIFYYRYELPRVNNHRRYKRVSLHTSNYYEARELLKIIFNQPSSNNSPKESINNIPHWETITDQLAEIKNFLLNRMNYPQTNKTDKNIAQTNNYTIKSMINKLIENNVVQKETKDRKRNIIKKRILEVGLRLTDNYERFHNTELIETIAKNIRADITIKGDTKRNHLRYIVELAKYAAKRTQNFFDPSVIDTLETIQKTSKSQKFPHKPYDIQQLRQLFDFKHNFFKNHILDFYVVLIGLFTGSRIGACLSLQFGDIIYENDIPCFYFRENSLDEPKIKHLKTEASIRKVPIHPTLIKLGFLDCVNNRKKKYNQTDKDYIFPFCKTKNNTYNNKYWDRQLCPFFLKIGVKSAKGDSFDFHSFRKTAAQELLNAGVPEAFINNVCGWSGDGELQESYSNISIKQLHQIMSDKMKYAYLDDIFEKWKNFLKKI